MLMDHAVEPRMQPETPEPVSPSPGRDWVFLNPERDEALARLGFLVEHRRPSGVLWGPPETGKTTVLRYFRERLQRTQRSVVEVDLRGLDGREFLWQLAAAFRLAPRTGEPSHILWRQLREHAEGLQLSRLQTVVLLDHAGRARDDCLSILQRFLGLHGPTEPWTTVILSARSEIPARRADFLAELSGLRIETGPLDRSETAAYAREFLQRSGRGAERFTPEALQGVFRQTGGRAGRINRLLELSLLAAEADGLATVDAEVVHQAALELG